MSVMAATLRRHADGTLTLITHAAQQYSSFLAIERVGNLEGIARARLEKHQKRRDLDAQAHEEYDCNCWREP